MSITIRQSSLSMGCIYLLAAPLVFWASLTLTIPYVNGDQISYRLFYKALAQAPLYEIPRLQLVNTGSAEPLYGAIMWLGANLDIEKDVYVAIWNTILAYALIRLTMLRRSNIIFVILLLTNFYFIVLLTAAERLKFAYIASAFAVASNSPWRSLIWTIVALLSHFQSMITFGAWASGYISRIRIRSIFRRRNFFTIALLGPIICAIGVVFALWFQASILAKINAYVGSGELFSLFNILILLIVSLICLPKKAEITIMLLVCALAAVAIGADRVNMIAVSIFIYVCIRDRRTSHPAALALMAYFTFKSMGFVKLIFAEGSGFAA